MSMNHSIKNQWLQCTNAAFCLFIAGICVYGQLTLISYDDFDVMPKV